MEDLYGGHVRMAEKVREGRRYPIGIWSISGTDAEEAAKAMLPYSILKKQQLKLFLKGRSTVKSRGEQQRLSQSAKKIRDEVSTAITLLKRPQWQGGV
jgi:hypothetical protein